MEKSFHILSEKTSSLCILNHTNFHFYGFLRIEVFKINFVMPTPIPNQLFAGLQRIKMSLG